MDANQFLDVYLEQNGKSEAWLLDKIARRIRNVGGLLSEEAATLLIARELGWGNDAEKIMGATAKTVAKMPITGYTEISDVSLDLIFDTSAKGDSYRKYPAEPLVVRVNRVLFPDKPKYGFATLRTPCIIEDGCGNTKYFDFNNFDEFYHGERDKTYPDSTLATDVSEGRQNLVGKTIAIWSWELFKGKNGFSLKSTQFTSFEILDPEKYVFVKGMDPLDDLLAADVTEEDIEELI